MCVSSQPTSSLSPGLTDLVENIVAHSQNQLPEPDLGPWREDLKARLQHLQQHPEQGLGHIEEHIRQASQRLQCLLVQKAMQDKADAVDDQCPECHHALSHKKRRVPRSIDAYCGTVKLLRTHGWCPGCEHWVFPADRALGLRHDSCASPMVQEISALLVAKMPAEQAESLSERVTGRRLSRSSLGREAQRQGDRALALRDQCVASPAGLHPSDQAKLDAAAQSSNHQPFTLIIQVDAWNIRERNHWGQTQARRKKNLELDRWHWVYTGTCFRLDHRVVKGRFKTRPRALITQRGFVATRGGLDALSQQLHYEARARGLTQAQRVLVIADGAVWIWNLATDRFKEAVQRLDLYHANTYLWAVAHELHGQGSREARQWVKPLLKQLRNDQVAQVITHLEDLKPSLTEAQAQAAHKTIEYYRSNQTRMQYQQARRDHEPIGSGAIESTARQFQCRMKRSGQFWSTRGDEALLSLDLFWRNERWELLFPHASITSIANN